MLVLAFKGEDSGCTYALIRTVSDHLIETKETTQGRIRLGVRSSKLDKILRSLIHVWVRTFVTFCVSAVLVSYLRYFLSGPGIYLELRVTRCWPWCKEPIIYPFSYIFTVLIVDILSFASLTIIPPSSEQLLKCRSYNFQSIYLQHSKEGKRFVKSFDCCPF